MPTHKPARSGSRETGVVQRVRRSLALLSEQPPHVLLACSGGEDSIALAWVLGDICRLGLLDLTIVHIHHGQHDRADAASDAVRRVGETVGVPVMVKHLDHAAITSHSGLGPEEAMRRERYLALANVANELSTPYIALAHHQQDQAETLLLHLLRGSGMDGLAGMSEISTMTVPWWQSTTEVSTLRIWRPFLNEPAGDVADIARRSGLPIVDDPTNDDLAYRRNAIRQRLLPVIEEISPGATAAIARSAGVIERDVAVLIDQTERLYEQCHEGGVLLGKPLGSASLGAAARVIRMWVLQETALPEISAARIDAVLTALLANRGGSRTEIGQGTSVHVRDGNLHLDPWENGTNKTNGKQE